MKWPSQQATNSPTMGEIIGIELILGKQNQTDLTHYEYVSILDKDDLKTGQVRMSYA